MDSSKKLLKKNEDFSFKVICSMCHKTIYFSGENGEVFEAICDKCSGL